MKLAVAAENRGEASNAIVVEGTCRSRVSLSLGVT